MLSLVYRSTSVGPIDETALTAILTAARDHNRELGITGLLVYRDGRFLQLLEGPDDAVEQVYALIRSDPRHEDVTTLDRNAVTERWFPDWSMAFEALDDDAVAGLDGFSEFFTPSGVAREAAAPSRTRALLHWFRMHSLAKSTSS